MQFVKPSKFLTHFSETNSQNNKYYLNLFGIRLRLTKVEFRLGLGQVI